LITLWSSALTVAAVSNLDNLAAGFALGLRGTRVRLAPNVVIAASTMIGTAIAMASGEAISGLLPTSLASAGGSLLIVSIGAGTLLAAVYAPSSSRHDPAAGLARAWSDRISWREALALGVGLSLNNVAAGLGAGAAGVSSPATTLMAGALSLLCVGGGSRLGWAAGSVIMGRAAPVLAGVGLVGVGVATLLGAR
jgi:putative Mn2+ efflux pump MntP